MGLFEVSAALVFSPLLAFFLYFPWFFEPLFSLFCVGLLWMRLTPLWREVRTQSFWLGAALGAAAVRFVAVLEPMFGLVILERSPAQRVAGNLVLLVVLAVGAAGQIALLARPEFSTIRRPGLARIPMLSGILTSTALHFAGAISTVPLRGELAPIPMALWAALACLATGIAARSAAVAIQRSRRPAAIVALLVVATAAMIVLGPGHRLLHSYPAPLAHSWCQKYEECSAVSFWCPRCVRRVRGR